MAVLDAWVYGLPVIATPVGGLPDIVFDGKNVLLFPAGNVGALSEKLEQIISNEELRNNVSNGDLELSKIKFDKQIIPDNCVVAGVPAKIIKNIS